MRKDAVASRSALLQAAWTRFAQDGPDVALSAVAETAGVGIGTLYRHFPRREDLIVGLAEELLGRVGRLAREHRDGWAEDPARRWRAFVTQLAALQVSAVVLPLQAREMIADLPEGVRERRAEALAHVETVLAAAREAGLLRADVTAERFTLSLAAITRPLPEPALRHLPDEGEWLVDLYLRGLRPDPA